LSREERVFEERAAGVEWADGIPEKPPPPMTGGTAFETETWPAPWLADTAGFAGTVVAVVAVATNAPGITSTPPVVIGIDTETGGAAADEG